MSPAVLLVVAVMLIVCLPACSQADWNASVSQHAPGTHVLLELPAGYEPSKQFKGFGNDGLETSILVAERPGQRLADMEALFSADAMAREGFSHVLVTPLARHDTHLYLQAERGTGEEVYTSFILAFEHAGGVAVVTAHVPSRFLLSGKVSAADIEAILMSASYETSP